MEGNKHEYAPIALFAFKRPKHLKITLDSLLLNPEIKKTFLYVFVDKFLDNNDKEANLKVKNLLKDYSYKFQNMEIIFNKKNKGLANNITEGIKAVFKKHEKIIVLEDDIEVADSFLNYMNRALDKYNDEKKVWHISGYVQPFKYEGEKDSFFWSYMNCWGWGTWRDRWQYYFKDTDLILKSFNKIMIKKFNFNNLIPEWDQIIDNKKNKINTWAVFWYASIFINNGLCLNPTKSLTRNIGFDNTGENCCEDFTMISQDIAMVKDLKFPIFVEEDKEIIYRLKLYFKEKNSFIFIKRAIVNKLPFFNFLRKKLKNRK